MFFNKFLMYKAADEIAKNVHEKYHNTQLTICSLLLIKNQISTFLIVREKRS